VNAGLCQSYCHFEVMTCRIGDHRSLGTERQSLGKAAHTMIDTGLARIGAVSMPQCDNLQIGDEVTSESRMPSADTSEPDNQQAFKHEGLRDAF
jgi:hypothetical protein